MRTPRSREGRHRPGRPGAARTAIGTARDRGELVRIAALLAVSAAIVAVLEVLRPGQFLTPRNLTSMAFQFPELGILALAIAVSMVTGGIDLSVVAVANLSGIVAGYLLAAADPTRGAGRAVLLAAAPVAGLAVGVACGAANGALVARVRIPPILATLGTMQLYAGLGHVLTGGAAVEGFPDPFLRLGNATVLGLPVPFVAFVGIAAASGLLLGRTRLGLEWYLIGTNPVAARFSGLRVRSAVVGAYLSSGVLAAAAGLLIAARTNSAKPDYGSSYLLQAVLISILGGVGHAGGSGRVLGIAAALAPLQLLSSGFNLLRASPYLKELSWGGLLLAVVILDRLLSRRAAPRPSASPDGEAGGA